ncbi:cytochrome P450 [Lacinutrix neustonica]|uniref:Cytochrome P450 n=1 Tax=Lacinutrix neustonica TaxID=2980107 RepID=A0A9E8MUW1_9FLAO|nr:cytochrome P450 [Lacinutrix neustonica]WAC01826.1 cytochrome P450 [Lacinutrix neustonica]
MGENKAGTFNDEEIYGNIFTLLLAGEDTTSNSLSWAVYYLVQHPKLLKK